MFFYSRNKNRKWEQRPRLYRGRFFYWRQIYLIFVALVIVAVVSSLGIFFKNAETFKVAHVTVSEGLNYLNPKAVEVIAGVELGKNIFSVNLGEIQTKLAKISWVKSVVVTRKFPDTIHISVKERTPSALLFTDRFFLIDEQAKIFKEVDSEDPIDYPILTGFQESDLKEYPELMRQRFTLCFDFLHAIQEQIFFRDDPISEVHCDSVLGFTVFTKNKALEIFYGFQDLLKKQETLEKFKVSQQAQNLKVTRIDLDSKNRIIVQRAMN